jgi:hypothetical protein
VIHNAGWALLVERDQHLGVTEVSNSELLVVTHHWQIKDFLIKIDGTLQISDLNADMVDGRHFEIDIFLSGRHPTTDTLDG